MGSKDGTLFRKKLIEKSERTEEFMAEWEKERIINKHNQNEENLVFCLGYGTSQCLLQ